MRKFSLFFSLLIIVLFNNAISQTRKITYVTGNFTTGDKEFLLNGKPFVIRAAELHYSRIPKEYWEHRIRLCKAMGMNTICIYLFWNLHEQMQDQFDFTGQNDVAAFVRLVQKNGMYCIVRPGPYVCAEWEMGGLPWWLLRKKDLGVRSLADSFFIERTHKFFKEAGKQLAPLQIQSGGNIIMVQVENEYATFGSDKAYMEAIRNGIRDAGFDKVQLFRCDWSSNFNKYQLDGVATTLNFGAGSNIDNQFQAFRKLYPSAPLMCSEYWTGWFDHWGKPHETRSISSFIGSLKDMMDRKVSFSLYMTHGGTSFAQWGGANAGPYSPMVSSYDYDAPIGEQGNVTDKFFAVRDLLKNYLQEGEAIGNIPDELPVIQIPAFELTECAPLFSNLPAPHKTADIQPMEYFNQGWGQILYRTQLPASTVKHKLVIREVHDWATVFINGKVVGKLDRRMGDTAIEIPAVVANARLDILVEATGRVNFGKAIIDHKGITEKVTLETDSTKKILKNWQVYNFPVDYEFQKSKKYTTAKGNSPGWYKGTFKITKTGDTWLDVNSWGKGMVWVNGHNLGRFWRIGPQQTLYLPGVWLKRGINEIIILDVDNPVNRNVAGVLKPILDKINPDASLLHRAMGQKLQLEKELPVDSGSFAADGGWKEIKFAGEVEGRYLCLEAVNAWRANDPLASIAELELIGKDGKALSALQWKVVYASSEEITSGNHAADKIFDLQESTFWQSQSAGGRPLYPHQVVIDIGAIQVITGMRYLPRSDNKTDGMIKDYRVFFKKQPFRL
ncbi:beta-galactosidase [Niastella vici]|uniref:Beta-galactosidase n=1 Tax=Niastella vici TaxID=1703345 RepID=A0A1V9FEW8_9BACT|nr:beta-galactosidase [Niastella vici]OQP56908.1 beta-galactosidase [Niastella vici]